MTMCSSSVQEIHLRQERRRRIHRDTVELSGDTRPDRPEDRGSFETVRTGIAKESSDGRRRFNR